MLMLQKQIVTFEFSQQDTTVELLIEINNNREKRSSVLNLYKARIEELIIINSINSLVFYLYTDDYTPLLELFECYSIPPKNYTMIVNSIESRKHLNDMLVRVDPKNSDKNKTLQNIKEAYRIAKDCECLGPVLDEFLRGNIQDLPTQEDIKRYGVLD